MVDRCGQQNAQFVALVSGAMQLQGNTSKFFAAFDSLVVFTTRSDVEMSRSSYFCANDRRTKPISLPLVHVLGVKIIASV